jgi:glycosyltransferase involved in cell wall biosynthesis
LPAHFLNRVFFICPPFDPVDPLALTNAESYAILKGIRKAVPELIPCPPPGREVWDSRIDPELKLEPEFEPILRYQIPGSSPKISVIIPTYNVGELARNVLRHLLTQSLARSDYEIILVDDGSTDKTQEIVRGFLAPEKGQVNFSLIHYPRTRPRRMGDSTFRAGLARNLGVKHSRGRILAFLDSDMIVPGNYLEKRVFDHERYDVIQSVRHHLRPHVDQAFASYLEIDDKSDTYIHEASYWGKFFEWSDWMAAPFFWKYTCTYALSVKREQFKRVGWFKRSFVQYGFEDTDLGYRLAKIGCSFYLCKTPLYHMSSASERIEDANSAWRRRMLLSRTAKTFYRNHLDEGIFEHFRSFMQEEWSPSVGLRRIQYDWFGNAASSQRISRKAGQCTVAELSP